MALENCPISELIENDNTYMNRIKHRKDLMNAHPIETYQCNDVCEPAVLELYEWMMGTYLPTRFPTMYQALSAGQVPQDVKLTTGLGPCLHNIPANTYIPLSAPSGTSALYSLGANIDTDILLLLPSSTSSDNIPIYHLQAYVTCFPSGFATQDKLGLPLAGIHKPVPGYKEKLEKSMDRFFAKMECGRAVRRVNWSVTTNDLLYSQGGNHDTYLDPRSRETLSPADQDGTVDWKGLRYLQHSTATLKFNSGRSLKIYGAPPDPRLRRPATRFPVPSRRGRLV